MPIKILASLLFFVFSPYANASEIKLGLLLDFTGPTNSTSVEMAKSARLAIDEFNEIASSIGSEKIELVLADSTCVDAASAVSRSKRLVLFDQVKAIIGPDCSSISHQVIDAVAKPHKVVLISPSATSSTLSSASDDGWFFRTVPSDDRQGSVLASILHDRQIEKIAISYVDDDYGAGLSKTIEENFTAMGGKVTARLPHIDGKASYTDEVKELAKQGDTEFLVVVGYKDQGGKNIIKASIQQDAFSKFILTDAMIGNNLIEEFGAKLEGSIGILPGSESEASRTFQSMAKENDFVAGAYSAESYDAAALLILSSVAAESWKSSDLREKIYEIANHPGIEIYPGEIARAIELQRQGIAINYQGASALELLSNGEHQGSYNEVEIRDLKFSVVKTRSK